MTKKPSNTSHIRHKNENSSKGVPRNYIFRFSWKIELDGYEWRDDILQSQAGFYNKRSNEKPPFLVAKGFLDHYKITEISVSPNPKNHKYRLYHPLHLYPALHRVLSDLSGEPNDILSFANDYGLLGIGGMVQMPNPGEKDWILPLDLHDCESLRQWKEEISKMRFLLKLWDNRDNIAYLKKRTFWTENMIYFIDSDNEELLDAQKEALIQIRRYEKEGRKDLIKRFVKKIIFPMSDSYYLIADNESKNTAFFNEWVNFGGSFYFKKEPAQILFFTLLNSELKKHGIRPGITLFPTHNGKWNDVRGYLVPETLLGAMYVQLYQEVTGEKIIKQCEYKTCNNYFVLTANKRGPKQRYCSDNCRKNAHRHK